MPVSSRRPSQNITSTDIEAPQKSELSAISDTPLFPLNPKELLQLTKMQIRAGLPASISCVSTFASGLICLAFAGKYGNAEELAGVTLGYTWSNIACLGILYAIDQGFCILGSQLFGARKHQELGALFQKHLYVWSLVLIPLILSLFFSDLLLIAIGLDYETSINTGIYLKCVIPSVIGLGFFDFMKNFLMARNIFYVPAAIQGSLTVLHIFWCYLFVDILNMPVAGIAIAKCITDVLCGAIIYLYVQYSDAAGESWIPWNKAYIENWWPHLKQTMAIGANVYIEWMSYEISLFVIGMLNDPYVLGAHGIVVTLTTVFFMVLLGNSVSMQTFIANAAGEGSYNKAQKFMAVGLSINFVFTFINAMIMIFKGEYLASFFTNDERITEIITTMIKIYGFAHIQDTFANHLSGVLRTLGNERTVIANFLFTYLVIAFNCQWIFGIVLGYGYPAVWAATGLGMSLMCGLMIRKIIKLDWKKEIAKIREKIDGENGGEYIEMADR